ncbi:MAG: hypothetical protein FWD35_06045 [Oscillospiraceae bacterium]|nr:hypothetical protein [Oscillospiraceae bacterium]
MKTKKFVIAVLATATILVFGAGCDSGKNNVVESPVPMGFTAPTNY